MALYWGGPGGPGMGSARRWPWPSGAWRQPWRPGNGECPALAVAIEGVVTVLGPGAGERSPRWGAAGVVLRAMLCSWRGSRPLGGVRAVLRAGRGFKGKSLPLGRAQWAVLQAKRSTQSDGIAVKVEVSL